MPTDDFMAELERYRGAFWDAIRDYERQHPGSVVGRDEPLGAEGDALWELLTEELGARIAMGNLGQIEPSLGEIHATAYWLAEAVTWVYRLEPRPSGEGRLRATRRKAE